MEAITKVKKHINTDCREYKIVSGYLWCHWRVDAPTVIIKIIVKHFSAFILIYNIPRPIEHAECQSINNKRIMRHSRYTNS